MRRGRDTKRGKVYEGENSVTGKSVASGETRGNREKERSRKRFSIRFLLPMLSHSFKRKQVFFS